LVCNNGTLHIPTRTLGSWESSHYLTRGVDYDYDPHARRPAWDRFIGDLIYTLGSDTVELLQEFGGYGMTTDTSLEFALWLVGQMGGGKSTFIEGTRAAASDRVTTLGLRAIERSRFALGNLAGKTLATCCEQPSDFIAATDVLNAIISGESITIEKKFCHPYDINPTVKLLWAMNSKPRVSDPNNGIFRRVKIVTFPPIDPADVDPTLKERIKGEGAGILNWLLVGLDRLRERGYFIIPETVCEATREYQKHADVPASFLEDHCERDPSPAHDDINFRELSGELYRSYREWALDSGHKPSSITKVADDWERLGLTRRRIDGQSWWYGLRICARGLSV
jgi:putative DNA primase/helicase